MSHVRPCSAPPNLPLVSHSLPPSHVKPGTDAAHPKVRRGTIKSPVRSYSELVCVPSSVLLCVFPIVCPSVMPLASAANTTALETKKILHVYVNVRASRLPVFAPSLVRLVLLPIVCSAA